MEVRPAQSRNRMATFRQAETKSRDGSRLKSPMETPNHDR